MLLACFKLFYIKDNSVENSVDFTKYKLYGAQDHTITQQHRWCNS